MAASEEGRQSPGPAAAALSAALARGNRGEFLNALRKTVDSFGGVPKLAQRAGLTAPRSTGRCRPRAILRSRPCRRS